MIAHADHMLRSLMFEEFLAYRGYEYKLEPLKWLNSQEFAYSIKVIHKTDGLSNCLCSIQEIRYFAGELNITDISWDRVLYPFELKKVVVSGGDVLVLENVPKVLSYLKTGMYQQFVLWRMENGL